MNIKQTKQRAIELLKTSDNLTKELTEILETFAFTKNNITLAEFLGWEEDVVYKCNEDKFIIMDNQLFMRNYAMRDWVDYDVSINRFEQLRQAKKCEPIKYYLKLKQEYIDFFNISGFRNVLAFNGKTTMMGYLLCENDKWQTEFTEKEINNIVLPEPLNLDMFEKVEVVQ